MSGWMEQVHVEGFRNLAQVVLHPGPHFNVIYGPNGAGKSSLLEAIYYLGALRSFRRATTEQLIGLELEKAELEAKIKAPMLSRKLQISLDRQRPRRIRLDDKRPRNNATWLNAVQMVLFHPGDIRLAAGGPDSRRAYLDRILEQLDPIYAATLSTYEKALRSRNRLLRDEHSDRTALRAFEEILVSSGSVIMKSRAEIIQELAPCVEQACRDVIGDDFPLHVAYRPRSEQDRLAEAFAQSYAKDRARGFTTEGPHADDLELGVGGISAKHHASQGQQRAIALALKVAELDIIANRTGTTPILLLDDVSSELDRDRNRKFFSLLAKMGGQVFLSTTHPEFILLEGQRVDFAVDAGSIKCVQLEQKLQYESRTRRDHYDANYREN